eukprot:4437795-Pyramimonas_sp.AAC.1
MPVHVHRAQALLVVRIGDGHAAAGVHAALVAESHVCARLSEKQTKVHLISGLTDLRNRPESD